MRQADALGQPGHSLATPISREVTRFAVEPLGQRCPWFRPCIANEQSHERVHKMVRHLFFNGLAAPLERRQGDRQLGIRLAHDLGHVPLCAKGRTPSLPRALLKYQMSP